MNAKALSINFVPNYRDPLMHQLDALLAHAGISQTRLAERARLSRLTVWGAINGTKDARLSSITAMFDELGYALVPVPKALLGAVHDFVSNDGRTLSRPAGDDAPLSPAQQAFRDARAHTTTGLLPRSEPAEAHKPIEPQKRRPRGRRSSA